MDVELLVVPDCAHAEFAARLLHDALRDTSVRASVVTAVIDTEDEARRRGFVGSPTFLLDGNDPFAELGATPGVACRIYPTTDGPRGTPALQDLRRAIKEAADLHRN